MRWPSPGRLSAGPARCSSSDCAKEVKHVSLAFPSSSSRRVADGAQDVAEQHRRGGRSSSEQHVGLALEVADRALVLVHGTVSLDRSALELRAEPEVLEAAYFGETSAA